MLYYQMLRDWYSNYSLYHLLGYIVTSDIKTMQEVAADVKNLKMGKTHFEVSYLPGLITQGLQLTREQYLGLAYGKDNDKIEKALLLFNVESMRNLSDENDRFPFHLYKEEQWTLEHIHAQNSSGLSKQVEWKSWLNLHLSALEDMLLSESDQSRKVAIEELILRIKDEIDNVTYQQFLALFQDATKIFSSEVDSSYIDQIQNMAILDGSTNSAISNSSFDVKRRLIMQSDYNNHFVPICTKRVFAKHYSTSKEQVNLHFWTESDRTSYVNEIVGDGTGKDGVINKYLMKEANGNNE